MTLGFAQCPKCGDYTIQTGEFQYAETGDSIQCDSCGTWPVVN